MDLDEHLLNIKFYKFLDKLNVMKLDDHPIKLVNSITRPEYLYTYLLETLLLK